MKSFALINVFWLLLLKLVVLDGVEVTQNIPDSVEPGKEYTVSFTVKKSNIQGFAKIQQTLPQGFVAVDPIETKGATFSFKDSKVKFIWMSLPSEDEFTVSYKLKVEETATGNHNIEGRFAFIENNERQNYTIAPVSVNVSTEEVASNDNNSSANEEPQEPEPPVEEPEVKVTRIVEPQPEKNEFVVTINVNKSTISGFAKVEDMVPAGFVAQEIENKGSMFTFKENKVKFLWMALPADESFDISYKLVAGDKVIPGKQRLSGKFNYVFNEETKEVAVPGSSIEVEAPATEVADNSTDNNAEENPENPEEENNSNNQGGNDQVTSTPPPETNVAYKVQVCASHRTVNGNYFRNKYGLSDKVSTEFHEGWTKYVIGQFGVYKEARDKRNKVWNNNKINDAFVTAYNSGKRITVQEALMISKQKWVQ